MKIAFIIQNMAQMSDSIGFDCIFQYNTFINRYGLENIRLFAVITDQSLHKGANIEPFDQFFPFIEKNPDAIV
ncbi:hypothetical protein ABTL63_19180, partial [Acinetobacter baumannii]